MKNITGTLATTDLKFDVINDYLIAMGDARFKIINIETDNVPDSEITIHINLIDSISTLISIISNVLSDELKSFPDHKDRFLVH